MKTVNKFQAGVIFATAVLGAVFATGCAYHNAASVQAAAGQVATVTITAKRMTADEKLAYDMQQGDVQTVVLSARRLTAEQKQAMLEEELRLQNTIARQALRSAHKAG
ncbi:MAG: hypothetical protein V4488_26165 [Pseudomonadota bacterium]